MSDPFAFMSAVGACGAEATFTVTESLASPPGPVQFTKYVRLVVRLPLSCDPLIPVHPEGDTLQEFAFCEVHVMVAPVLCAIVTDPSDPFALMSTVGALVVTFINTESAATPPGPQHVM